MSGLTSIFAPLGAESWAMVDGLRKSVVLIHSGYGHGCGVIWDSNGLVITNFHVVGRRDQVEVELADGRKFSGKVIGADARNDLAAIRLEASELPAIPVGDSKALRVGELIIAIGHPLGVRGTATLGIVSGVYKANGDGQPRREVVQADVVLAPGNSGGPLVNAAGQMVGIASMIVSPGIAIAVPSHVTSRFVATLSGPQPYIGVTLRPVAVNAASITSLYERQDGNGPQRGTYVNGYGLGLLLLEVEDGSPADAAGLLPGDVLLAVNGNPIEQPTDLGDRLVYNGTEQAVHLALLRGKNMQEFDIIPRVIPGSKSGSSQEPL